MDSARVFSLTAALYRVTDRMDDSEALKWRLRDSALRLNELYFQDESLLSFADLERRGKEVDPLLKSVIRMLELAASHTFVSRVNFEVLLREYRDLQKIIFHPKEQPSISELSESKFDAQFSSVTDTKEQGEKPPKKERATTGKGGTGRQEKILVFLSEKGSASVGELSSLFEGQVSEKTMQRDLQELMKIGTVRAEGDRRWRRYFLAEEELRAHS